MTALETALTGLSLGTPVMHANLTLFPLLGGDAGGGRVQVELPHRRAARQVIDRPTGLHHQKQQAPDGLAPQGRQA